MTATPQERKHAPKIDSRQAASDLFDWLERGGNAPEYLPVLPPRQYEEVLGKVRERIAVYERTRTVKLDPGALDALLDVASRMPATRAGTQARAVAVRFAVESDPSGAVAISILGKVLADVSLGATDAEFFIQQSGSLATVIDGLASAWAETTEDRRPASGQTTALARLVSAELTAGGSGGRGNDDGRAAVLRNLATSLRSVRVGDHRGARDPLLQGIATACDVSADTLTAPVPKPTDSILPAVVETASGRRVRMIGELRTLSDGFQLELAKLDDLEDTERSLRTETFELRRKRDDLERDVAGFQATVGRLNGDIRRLNDALTDAARSIAEAETLSSKWRGEAEQTRREAEIASREMVAKAGRDVDKLMERFLAPVIAIVGDGSFGGDDLQPIAVNLGNLQQKVKALTDRMGSEPAWLESAHAAPNGGSIDESGN